MKKPRRRSRSAERKGRDDWSSESPRRFALASTAESSLANQELARQNERLAAQLSVARKEVTQLRRELRANAFEQLHRPPQPDLPKAPAALRAAGRAGRARAQAMAAIAEGDGEGEGATSVLREVPQNRNGEDSRAGAGRASAQALKNEQRRRLLKNARRAPAARTARKEPPSARGGGAPPRAAPTGAEDPAPALDLQEVSAGIAQLSLGRDGAADPAPPPGARRSSRSTARPKSYATTALNAKVRKGHNFFDSAA